MNNLKRLVALVLALMMTLALVGSAMAAVPQGTITITNIDEGDKVTLYKIVEWDETAGNWKFSGNPNLTKTEGENTVPQTVADVVANGIDRDEAAALVAAKGSALGDAEAVGSTGTFTKANLDVGMYLALIEDVDKDNVYNPIFVSVNFAEGTPPTATNGTVDVATSTLAATTTQSAAAKKQPLELTKTIDYTNNEAGDTDAEKASVKPGDVIPFKVTTKAPTYAENYTDPKFVITDTLSGDIELTEAQRSAITVTVEGMETAPTTDYVIAATATGYTVTFTSSFLHRVSGAPTVTVSYKATVKTTAAQHNVDRMTNDVKLDYSNNPNDLSSYKTLEEKTEHYTFSIDANINGENSGSEITKELVKVGIAADGTPLTEWTTSEASEWSNKTFLDGAIFKLTSDAAGNNIVKDNLQSADGGFISIMGLDEGTYYLHEVTAPEGYLKTDHVAEIVIDGTFVDQTIGGVLHRGVLTGYTITIDGTATSSYSVTNSGTDAEITVITRDNTSETMPINNLKGVTLPSTGGIGTTIFYVVGIVLVLGAAAIIIARRKAEQE